MNKCDLCDKPAVVHEVRVRNGVRKEIHLCEVHAQSAGILITSELSPNLAAEKAQEALAKIAARHAKAPTTVCKECGMNIQDFKKTSTLGCPECYEAFAKQLTPLIERAQRGATHHCGKAPKRTGETVDRQHMMRKLLKELEEAVAAEQYERAAQLRDHLRTMEAGTVESALKRGELGKA